jgi:hypothetical protein
MMTALNLVLFFCKHVNETLGFIKCLEINVQVHPITFSFMKEVNNLQFSKLDSIQENCIKNIFRKIRVLLLLWNLSLQVQVWALMLWHWIHAVVIKVHH